MNDLSRRLEHLAMFALACATALILGLVLGVASCASGGRRSATPAGAPGAPGRTRTGAAKAPNIVFVLTDDLTWNLVPYLPQVRQLQRHGLTFTDYVVSDSLCCPSRSTIFTGAYPHNTGVFSNDPPDGGFELFRSRGHEAHTFATALRAQGYRTALMGKYLNGYRPARREGQGRTYVPPGWDEWDVAGSTGYKEFGYTLNENGKAVRYGAAPQDYLTDVLAQKGADFIRRSAHSGRPFLLELSTFAPHRPSVAAPRHANALPGLRQPRTAAFNEADVTDKPMWLSGRPPLSPRQIRTTDDRYLQRVRSVLAIDDLLARVRRELADAGVQNRTYVVFSSDNGFHLGEHRLPQGKMTAFDTDIRVPLVVTGPGVPAGRSVSAPVQNTDLCPTFLELAGASATGTVDGRSLVPFLRTGTAPDDWRGAMLVEHHRPAYNPDDPDAVGKGDSNPPTYAALRTERELYVEYIDGSREYYDLAADPEELDNTVGRLPPDQKARLERALHALTACSGSACTVPDPDPHPSSPPATSSGP